MGELNERVDELKDEVNGLRNDLEDLEDAVDAIAERLEEELVRANKARLSIWTQSGEGKKYLRLKLIWDTFLSLRTVTERDRREYALRVVARNRSGRALLPNVRAIRLNDCFAQGS